MDSFSDGLPPNHAANDIGLNTDDAIDPKQEIIEAAFAGLEKDIGAMYTDQVLGVLASVYHDTDKAKWQRIYHQLKKHCIASEVKKAVIIFSRKSKFKKSSTSNTSKDSEGNNQAPNQHKHSTKPDINFNALVELNDYGVQILLIESKAVKLIMDSLNGFLAHDITSQTWHEYTGMYWKPLESSQLPDETLLNLIDCGAGQLGFRPCYKNAIKSLLVDGAMLPMPKVDHSKLSFNNGLLDLNTGILEVITPDNAPTWGLTYAYQLNSDCPNIKAWLKQSVNGDMETVEFLRAIMAAILHGRNDLQKFLHLKGSGGTGKGVFLRLLTTLMGERNTVMTSLDQLEQNRFETAALFNKRLAVISDSDKYGGSINILKAITGQDSIRLERKHQQQSGNFVFQGWVVMASNESLQVTDHTSALDRRRITVIFDRRASNEEKQAWASRGGEAAVLHGELPGLVNWLLELSPEEVTKIIYNPPERIRKADLEAMTATNPVADWVLECCIPDTSAWSQIGDKREIREIGYETQYENANSWLYANYLQWSLRSHKTPLAIRRFRELLIQTCTTLNISVHEARLAMGMGIHGLRIKQKTDQSPSSDDELVYF